MSETWTRIHRELREGRAIRDVLHDAPQEAKEELAEIFAAALQEVMPGISGRLADEVHSRHLQDAA